MNHLAHLRLAAPDPDEMVGQVLADFVTAGAIPAFAPAIQAGIRRHQRIDAYTDGHPVVARARRRMRPPNRRFAGVFLDLFFDHFLAREWRVYGDGRPLEEFADFCYGVLRDRRALPAPRYGLAIDAMRRDNWLVGYADLAVVDRVCRAVSRRFPRKNPLASGAQILRNDYEAFRGDFGAFFPALARRFARVPHSGSGRAGGTI